MFNGLLVNICPNLVSKQKKSFNYYMKNSSFLNPVKETEIVKLVGYLDSNKALVSTVFT